jgi:TonB family protein
MQVRRCIVYAILTTFLSAQQSPAQDRDRKEEVFSIGGDVSPPKLVHKVEPGHAKGSGAVVIEMVVSSKGVPRDLKVIESLGTDLDRSALAAVDQWRFEPARKKDKPVAVKVTVEIRFHEM